MTDNNTSTSQDDKQTSGDTDTVKYQFVKDQDDKKDQEQTIPYARLQEVIKERNDLRSRIESLENAQKKVRDEELKKQGEYKTLLEEKEKEMAGLKTQADAYADYTKARKNMLYERLDESQRKIADSISSLEGLELFVESVSKSKSISTDGSSPGSTVQGQYPGGYSTKVEFAAKDPDGYAKWKAEHRPPMASGTIRFPGDTESRRYN